MTHRALWVSLCATTGALACGGHPPAGMTVAEWQNKRQECLTSGGQNCAFQAGMLAKDTLPSGWPTGNELPIDTIVLIMQENRSFDHYFSTLTNGADVASPTATNPDSSGAPVQRFHQMAYCFNDTDHTWAGLHNELDNGKLDGFVTDNQPNGARTMGYYNQDNLPFAYALAQTFAMSDRHFCSMLGPTYPNRMFYLAGTSFGITESNLAPYADPNGTPYPNLMTEMNAAGVDWVTYSQDVPQEAIFISTYVANPQHFQAAAPCPSGPCRNFFDDAKAGQLPPLVFVEASDGGSTTYPIPVDEHPPADYQVGQQWLQGVLNAAMNSPQWPHMAIFISYDENGGLYDHVVPPPAIPPDDLQPDSRTFAFNQYGFRVPLMIVSPYAKRGYVSHEITDHTSILRFVEARFNLPAMTKRDANAEPPYDMFDFSHPNVTVPSLPTVVVNESAKQACMTAFPPSTSGL